MAANQCTRCNMEADGTQITDYKFLCDNCLEWYLESKVHYVKYDDKNLKKMLEDYEKKKGVPSV